MKSDDICEEYADQNAKLTIRMLDKENVVIEGDSTALSFLGKLILALAEGGEHCRQLGPKGPGKQLFSPESTIGIYIHLRHDK